MWSTVIGLCLSWGYVMVVIYRLGMEFINYIVKEYEMKLAVFDTETTGADPREDRIVSAFYGVMDETGTMLEAYDFLINPEYPIAEQATAVHKITNERAQAEGLDKKVALVALATLFQTHADIPVVIYNATFDTTILNKELERIGREDLKLPWNLVLDPFVMDKHYDKWRKGKRTLTYTSEYYGVSLGDDAHAADADCRAAGQVAYAIMDKYLGHEPTVEDIVQYQIDQKAWKAEQAAGLQKWLRKSNHEAIVEGTWPELS